MRTLKGLWQPFWLTIVEFMVVGTVISEAGYQWSWAPWLRVAAFVLVQLPVVAFSMFRWARKHGPHEFDRPKEGEPEASIRLMRYYLREAERMAKRVEKHHQSEK